MNHIFHSRHDHDDEADIADATVRLLIRRVRLASHSPLLAREFEGAVCAVEWSLLDFAREQCETPTRLRVPTNSDETLDFDFDQGLCDHEDVARY